MVVDERGSGRILVISLYYPPDVASTGLYAAEICGALRSAGFGVDVLAGQPSYSSSSPSAPEREVMNGVRIHRIWLAGARGRDRLIDRLRSYALFLFGAWVRARGIVKSGNVDVLLSFHNPPFVGLIGAHLARAYGLPFVFAWWDLYPDALQVAGWNIPAPLVWLWENVNRWILSHVSKVIVLGERPKWSLCHSKGVEPGKVEVIPIWAYPELEPVVDTLPLKEKLGIPEHELFVLYAGNMGIMHPVEVVLDAACQVQGLPIRFLFIGDGVRRRHLLFRADKENLRNVAFLPYQPEQRFREFVAAADICVVAFKPGMEKVTVPSRVFTFLSAGKPVITIMAPDSDVASLVIDTKCGWNVTDSSELAELLCKLVTCREELSERGQISWQIYRQFFARDRILSRYVNLITSQLPRLK